MRVRVKICGITRIEDAELAVELGADALGLNFFPPSPRFLRVEEAEAIRRRVPALVNVVAVFVNPEPQAVQRVVEEVGVDTLQFHGTEPPELCRSFGRPYIKAIGVEGEVDLEGLRARYEDAAGLLLDRYDPVRWGGTGRPFDWSRAGLPAADAAPGTPGQGAASRSRLILAGGLSVENVEAAIRHFRPYGVDVCGGVEAGKGRKDPERMRAFFERVRDVRIPI